MNCAHFNYELRLVGRKRHPFQQHLDGCGNQFNVNYSSFAWRLRLVRAAIS